MITLLQVSEITGYKQEEILNKSYEWYVQMVKILPLIQLEKIKFGALSSRISHEGLQDLEQRLNNQEMDNTEMASKKFDIREIEKIPFINYKRTGKKK